VCNQNPNWAIQRRMDARRTLLPFPFPPFSPPPSPPLAPPPPPPWRHEGHIRGVVGHFKGKILEWDVVNEALRRQWRGRPETSFWQTVIGNDYIIRPC